MWRKDRESERERETERRERGRGRGREGEGLPHSILSAVAVHLRSAKKLICI